MHAHDIGAEDGGVRMLFGPLDRPGARAGANVERAPHITGTDWGGVEPATGGDAEAAVLQF